MRRGVLLAAAILVGAMAVPTTASATSAEGVSATVLWQRTADSTGYVFREITIAPSGNTGWHWHNGRLYGVIKQGTLTHNMATARWTAYIRRARAFTNPAAPTACTSAANLGDTPLVMQILYILPAGSALSEDAPATGCGF